MNDDFADGLRHGFCHPWHQHVRRPIGVVRVRAILPHEKYDADIKAIVLAIVLVRLAECGENILDAVELRRTPFGAFVLTERECRQFEPFPNGEADVFDGMMGIRTQKFDDRYCVGANQVATSSGTARPRVTCTINIGKLYTTHINGQLE